MARRRGKSDARWKKSGAFTKRLIWSADMADAVAELVSPPATYTFVVQRARIEWSSGAIRDPTVLLRKEDQPIDNDGLSAALIRSRNVAIVVNMPDGGLARVRLTERDAQTWIDTEAIRGRLEQFRERLRNAHGGSYALTPNFWMGFFYGTFAILLAAIVTVSADKSYVPASENGPAVFPAWYDVGTNICLIALVIELAIMGIVGLVRLTGGGMRLMPKYLSADAILAALYRVRLVPATTDVLKITLGGVLAALIMWRVFRH